MTIATRRWFAVLSGFLLVLPSAVAAKKYDKEATDALLAAAYEGEADKVLAALAAGADPNAADEDGDTALHLAGYEGMWGKEGEVVKALLAAKAKIEAPNKSHLTPLMMAARQGQGRMVEALVAEGAAVNARKDDGWTALMLAAYNGQFMAVDALLAVKADVNVKDEDGWDAVQWSVSNGHGSIAEKLLDAGATLPAASPDGQPMLVNAVYGGDLASVRLVLERHPQVDARDHDSWTALEIAAYNGYPQIVMELLRAGADSSLEDPEGYSALERAQSNEHHEIVALLGGAWEKPPLAGGKTIALACAPLGGAVEAHVGVEGTDLVLSTTYPHPLSWYFGGGLMNRAKSAKQFTYDALFEPGYYLDTDANPKTGRKAGGETPEAAGSEYSLEYSQYGTSVTIQVREGDEMVDRQVYANVLSPSLLKGEEDVDLAEAGFYPAAENDRGVLKTRLPLSFLGLEAGKKLRVVARVAACPHQEATFVLGR
jgi:ankyrin repeat protein